MRTCPLMSMATSGKLTDHLKGWPNGWPSCSHTPGNRPMTSATLLTDSVTIAKATPKRRHVDLKVSLLAALTELEGLGLLVKSVDGEGLHQWRDHKGNLEACERVYLDSLRRPGVTLDLGRMVLTALVLRARHPGDTAAIVEALKG